MVDDDLLWLVVVEREGAVQLVVLSPLGSLRQAGHTQVAQPTATLPAAAVIPLKVKSRVVKIGNNRISIRLSSAWGLVAAQVSYCCSMLQY